MGLFASFSIVPCPECGATILARGIYHSQAEPKLDTTRCEQCQAELQIMGSTPLQGSGDGEDEGGESEEELGQRINKGTLWKFEVGGTQHGN